VGAVLPVMKPPMINPETGETFHKVEEIIICPECKTIQSAYVEQSIPFWIYLHECKNCGYIIGESEWEKVEESVIKVIKLIKAVNQRI
jgi:rubredoxin